MGWSHELNFSSVAPDDAAAIMECMHELVRQKLKDSSVREAAESRTIRLESDIRRLQQDKQQLENALMSKDRDNAALDNKLSTTVSQARALRVKLVSEKEELEKRCVKLQNLDAQV